MSRPGHRVKLRRALGLLLFAAGCFGLGLAAARWLGWVTPGPGPAPMVLPGGLPPPVGTEPRIYIDAGTIELHDASLHIDPPEPPRVDPPP